MLLANCDGAHSSPRGAPAHNNLPSVYNSITLVRLDSLALNVPAVMLHIPTCSFNPGVYLVNLDVSGPGGVGSAQTQLTVSANIAPIASAGGPYSTTVGVPVVVSAEQSSDPDGDPLTYSWVLYRGNVQIGNYSGPALNMKLNNVGAYTLKLTVADDRGGASTAVAQITSYSALPSPPPPAVYTTQAVPAMYTPPMSTRPAVIAAVPAPPPSSSSALRLAGPPPGVAATPTYMQSVYTPTPSVYTPSVVGGSSTISPGFTVPTTPTPSPAPAMCLFTKNGTNSTSAWDMSVSNADWSKLNPFSLTNTYWAPCTQTAAAPVSGSNTAAVSTGAASPLASSAVIRSPEAFVTATGSATQVRVGARAVRCSCLGSVVHG